MEDRNYEGMKTDGSYHVVQLEKGIESEIQVYEYSNHHQFKHPFHIQDLDITNVFGVVEDQQPEDEEEEAGEAIVQVFGYVHKEFSHLVVDDTIYFVYGDIIVPAKQVGESQYTAIILPNLPGGVKLYVSFDGLKPASQVMKFKFPSKPPRSVSQLKLEQRLANLLLFNNENREEMMARLRECDNRELHSEIVLKDFLSQWVFEDRKSVYSLDEEGQGVTHLFSSLGYAWAIGLLGRLQLSLDFKDAFGWTPLHWAAFHGRREAVTSLLIGGADPTLRTEQATKYFPSGCTSTDDTDYIGAEQTIEYPSGCTAADIAARRGHDLLASYLEEIRTDPLKILKLPALRKKESRNIHTYRRYVSRNSHGKLKADGTHHVVELEKGLKSDVCVYEYDNHHQVNCPYRIEEVHINMDHDSQEPVVEVYGNFQKDNLPLDEAEPLFVFGDLIVPAERVSEGLYKSILLPNIPGGYDFYVSLDGITPISQIMRFKCSSEAKEQSDSEFGLITRLAKLLVANNDHLTHLKTKFRERNIKKPGTEIVMRELVKEWIIEGCKIGLATDEQGQGVLHLIASLGYAWAIALCIQSGFSVDSKDASGWTALHWAAYYGRKGAVVAMLISGADPSVVDEPTTEYPTGCKAADIAYSRGHDDIAAYLVKESEARGKHFAPAY